MICLSIQDIIFMWCMFVFWIYNPVFGMFIHTIFNPVDVICLSHKILFVCDLFVHTRYYFYAICLSIKDIICTCNVFPYKKLFVFDLFVHKRYYFYVICLLIQDIICMWYVCPYKIILYVICLSIKDIICMWYVCPYKILFVCDMFVHTR